MTRRRAALAGGAGLAAVGYVVLPLRISDDWLAVLVLAGIAAVGAYGLDLLTGRTGVLSVGHAVFLAAGAYTAAVVGGPLPVWLVAGGVVGAVLGLASLNRPNMLVAGAAIAGALLLARRVRPAVLVAAGILAGLSPVVVRNVVVSGQWSLVSSHGGLNLYIGNSAEATGFYHAVPGITPDIAGQSRDAKRVAEQALGRPLSDSETSDYFLGLATAWLATRASLRGRLLDALRGE